MLVVVVVVVVVVDTAVVGSEMVSVDLEMPLRVSLVIVTNLS